MYKIKDELGYDKLYFYVPAFVGVGVVPLAGVAIAITVLFLQAFVKPPAALIGGV